MAIPDQPYLHECFDYCSESGALTWKRRPRSHFDKERSWKAWNARFPDRRADQPDGRGYFQVKINGKKHLSHRVIFVMIYGVVPQFIDHVNGDKSNNSISNLRPATKQQNSWNARRKSNGSTEFKGVSPIGSRWRATICIGGKLEEIGRFDSPIEAANAYDARAVELFGEFARTNLLAGEAASRDRETP